MPAITSNDATLDQITNRFMLLTSLLHLDFSIGAG
jgi:hypothetical protein